MPGLGKASAELLADVGIATPDMLRKIGPEEAWRRLRFAHGKRVTITWIYALDIAVRGIPWRELGEARARKLRAAAKAILSELEPADHPMKRSRKPLKRV